MIKKHLQALMLTVNVLCAMLALACCNSNSSQPQTQPVETVPAQPVTYAKDTFGTGTVIPQVPLHIDAAQSYALYLPAGYSDSAKLPVIIFFDPHGEGALPVKLYHQLADKYHFILMGSNNSRNLIDFSQDLVFANNLINEALERYSIDKSKITLMGFSGGAKVALGAGAENPLISTIIYAGSKDDIRPNHAITLLGFAGTRDMNYTDLVQFNWDLKKTQLPHYFVEWKGKHEFPSAEVFNDAFQFLTTGKIDNYEKKQASISPEKVEEELTIKKKYIHAFNDKKDLAWWKNEIAGLNVKAKTDPMYARMLGFISLACYSFSNQNLRNNQIDDMGRVLEVYKIADPGNKDCDTLYQVYLRRKSGQ
jgi:predicted esterase